MFGVQRENVLPLAAAVAGLLVLVFGGILYLRTPAPAPPAGTARIPYRSHAEIGSQITPTPSPTPAPNGPRLLIPKINVSAHIENVGVDSRGNMAVPSSPWNVGWYDRGPQPGDPGDAVFDGHLDWYTTGPAVFWNLGKLSTGDQIVVVRADGRRVTFTVDAVQTVAWNAHPVGLFAKNGPARISLITCTGAWDAGHANYLQRLIVNAHPATQA